MQTADTCPFQPLQGNALNDLHAPYAFDEERFAVYQQCIFH